MAVTEEFKQEWKIKFWPDVLRFYSNIHPDMTETELFDQIWEERRLFQTDLFWAAKDVLKYDLADAYICWKHPKQQAGNALATCAECGEQLSPYWTGPDDLYPVGSSPHRLITDFFVHKNPDITIWEQPGHHTRLLMAPRGSYKSSVDQADCVQWIVCFPDVRILVLSATERYSIDFVEAVRNHFVRPERQNGKIREIIHLSWFQCLFPEHTISSFKKEEAGEFTSPARTSAFKGIEPSVFAFGMKATKSGYHAEIGKFDDCVSDSNSGPSATPMARSKVAQEIRLARGLIMPNGFRDILGTPYDLEDAYAPMIRHAEKYPKELKFLRRPCWEMKPTGIGKTEDELKTEDYDLYFPIDGKGEPQQTYANLLAIKRESDLSGDTVFINQYLCSPRANRKIVFPEELVRSCFIPPDRYYDFPQIYTAIATWDIAYSKTKDKRRDFSVGTVGWFDPFGRLFIKDIVRGQFGKYELVQKMAEQAAKWRVSAIKIEGSNGADFLETDLRLALAVAGYHDCLVEFFPVDATEGAKNIRAELLEGLMANHKIFFSSEINRDTVEAVVKEFTAFNPENGYRKDDAIDSIAHLARFAPPAEEMPEDEKQAQQAVFDILRDKITNEMIFTAPELPPPPPPPIEVLPMDYYESEYGRMPIKSVDDWIYGR